MAAPLPFAFDPSKAEPLGWDWGRGRLERQAQSWVITGSCGCAPCTFTASFSGRCFCRLLPKFFVEHPISLTAGSFQFFPQPTPSPAVSLTLIFSFGPLALPLRSPVMRFPRKTTQATSLLRFPRPLVMLTHLCLLLRKGNPFSLLLGRFRLTYKLSSLTYGHLLAKGRYQSLNSRRHTSSSLSGSPEVSLTWLGIRGCTLLPLGGGMGPSPLTRLLMEFSLTALQPSL